MKCFILNAPEPLYQKLANFTAACFSSATSALYVWFNNKGYGLSTAIRDSKCLNDTLMCYSNDDPDKWSEKLSQSIDLSELMISKKLVYYSVDELVNKRFLNMNHMEMSDDTHTILYDDHNMGFEWIEGGCSNFTTPYDISRNSTTSGVGEAFSGYYGISWDTIMLTVAGLGIVASSVVGGVLYKKCTRRNLVDDVEEVEDLEAVVGNMRERSELVVKFICGANELQAKKLVKKDKMKDVLQQIDTYSIKDLKTGIDWMDKQLSSEDASNNHNMHDTIDTSKFGSQISGESTQETVLAGAQAASCSECIS